VQLFKSYSAISEKANKEQTWMLKTVLPSLLRTEITNDVLLDAGKKTIAAEREVGQSTGITYYEQRACKPYFTIDWT